MRKIIILFLIFMLIFSGCLDKDLNNQQVNTENNNNKKNTIIDNTKKNNNSIENNLENKENKIDNDEARKETNNGKEQEIDNIDGIVLKGKLNEYGKIEGLMVYIKNEDYTIDVSKNSIMGGNLELKDIDGDEIKDIVVYEYLGGSGDIRNLYIYKKINNRYKRIMGPERYVSQNNFHQEYLGDGNIYFKDDNTGFEVEYNIVVPYENDGWKLDEVQSIFGIGGKAWVDPYSSFEIVDIDKDGIYEVKAGQIMCGISHVDIVGRMETIYSLIDGIYSPTEVIYYKVTHDTWETEKIGEMKIKEK